MSSIILAYSNEGISEIRTWVDENGDLNVQQDGNHPVKIPNIVAEEMTSVLKAKIVEKREEQRKKNKNWIGRLIMV